MSCHFVENVSYFPCYDDIRAFFGKCNIVVYFVSVVRKQYNIVNRYSSEHESITAAAAATAAG